MGENNHPGTFPDGSHAKSERMVKSGLLISLVSPWAVLRTFFDYDFIAVG